jgi:hypothetical protein
VLIPNVKLAPMILNVMEQETTAWKTDLATTRLYALLKMRSLFALKPTIVSSLKTKPKESAAHAAMTLPNAMLRVSLVTMQQECANDVMNKLTVKTMKCVLQHSFARPIPVKKILIAHLSTALLLRETLIKYAPSVAVMKNAEKTTNATITQDAILLNAKTTTRAQLSKHALLTT